MKTEVSNAAALKQLVSTWVDKSFNFIDLNNAEKVLDNTLFEFIQVNESEETAITFLNEYDYIDGYINSSYKSSQALVFVKEHYEDEYSDFLNNDNYPLWNTIFEFRSEPPKAVLESAIKAGFGIIEKTEYYNTMLFVKGAGYSFYSAHWIPMYLGLPYIDKSKYANIDFESV